MERLTPSDFYLNPNPGKPMDERSFKTALRFVAAVRMTASSNRRDMQPDESLNQSSSRGAKWIPRMRIQTVQ